jgi:hypothetical protein
MNRTPASEKTKIRPVVTLRNVRFLELDIAFESCERSYNYLWS